MYKPINKWTKTKILDYIKTNFTGKSVRTMENGERCMYRDNDGHKCAVGLFIPDEKYDPLMEGECARGVVIKFGLEKFMPLDNDALMQLQQVHDESLIGSTSRNMIRWVKANVEDLFV